MFNILANQVLSDPPSVHEALSGIFGSVSLTAWICLLLPQLISNYKSQSADGLSMGFLFIWLMGDIANLSGALWSQLAPTAITLGSYFCCADIVLISQCVYYNTLNARRSRRRRSSAATDPSEERPLLQRRRSSSLGLPGSHRRRATHEESNLDPITRIVTGEDETPDSSPWLHNTLSLVAVHAVGILGWFLSDRFGAAASSPNTGGEAEPHEAPAIGLILGYFSAACYLCARIPQIIKNYREKSCEGLALLFFLLSLTGNLTYGLSLVSYSQEPDYLLKALPWLLGSLGTMVEDCIIFVQFRLYSPKRQQKATVVTATA